MPHEHVVAVDIDGVLTDTTSSLLALAARLGISLRAEDLTTQRLEDNPALTREEAVLLVNTMHETALIDAKIAEEDLDGLTRLAQQCLVDIVTSRPSELKSLTLNWLQRHGVPFRQLVHSVDFNKKALANSYDFVIEDNVATCELFAKAGAVPLLIDRPWNRSLPESAVGLVRARLPSVAVASTKIIEISRRVEPLQLRNRQHRSSARWRREFEYIGDARGLQISANDQILAMLLGCLPKQARGGLALDLCCGIGVASTTLARHGYRVVAIDQSALKTAYCSANLALYGDSALSHGTVTAEAIEFTRIIRMKPAVIHFDPDWGPPGHDHDAHTLEETCPAVPELLSVVLPWGTVILIRLPADIDHAPVRSSGAQVLDCGDTQTGERFIYAIWGMDANLPVQWQENGRYARLIVEN